MKFDVFTDVRMQTSERPTHRMNNDPDRWTIANLLDRRLYAPRNIDVASSPSNENTVDIPGESAYLNFIDIRFF